MIDVIKAMATAILKVLTLGADRSSWHVCSFGARLVGFKGQGTACSGDSLLTLESVRKRPETPKSPRPSPGLFFAYGVKFRMASTAASHRPGLGLDSGVDKSVVPQSRQFHSVVAIVNLILARLKIARGPCVTFGAIYKSVQR